MRANIIVAVDQTTALSRAVVCGRLVYLFFLCTSISLVRINNVVGIHYF